MAAVALGVAFSSLFANADFSIVDMGGVRIQIPPYSARRILPEGAFI